MIKLTPQQKAARTRARKHGAKLPPVNPTDWSRIRARIDSGVATDKQIADLQRHDNKVQRDYDREIERVKRSQEVYVKEEQRRERERKKREARPPYMGRYMGFVHTDKGTPPNVYIEAKEGKDADVAQRQIMALMRQFDRVACSFRYGRHRYVEVPAHVWRSPENAMNEYKNIYKNLAGSVTIKKDGSKSIDGGAWIIIAWDTEDEIGEGME